LRQTLFQAVERGIMSIATGASPIQPEPGLLGQTVVVIGGSAGIGLERARRERAQRAKLFSRRATRNALNTRHANSALYAARRSTTNFDQLDKFFDGLPTPIDHALVSGAGPYYSPPAELEIEKARRDVEASSPAAVAGRSLRRKEGSSRRHLLFMSQLSPPRFQP
jgi:NAD(P)-dependent dehydrogenase (short-subunit alcohol dehydrogenase family)